MIFNSSMPRSGSELLQVLLHQNPRIYASPTSPLLEYQFGARSNYELPEVKAQDPHAMQAAFIAMCKGMAESYYSALTDRPIVCDKNRGWSHYFEWVEQWHPNPKMICMVRDLRSIVASMERIYRANRHRPTGPDNPAQLQGMTVEQRAAHWLTTPPVGLALKRLEDAGERGQFEKMLFVRYEDLCAAPHEQMARVYAFIGEEPFKHDFTNIVKEVVEDDSHFGPYGQHKIAKTIAFPVRGWKDALPEPVAEMVFSAAHWYQQTFNYIQS